MTGLNDLENCGSKYPKIKHHALPVVLAGRLRHGRRYVMERNIVSLALAGLLQWLCSR